MERERGNKGIDYKVHAMLQKKALSDICRDSNLNLSSQDTEYLARVDAFLKASENVLIAGNEALKQKSEEENNQLYVLGIVYIQNSINYIAAQDVAEDFFRQKKQSKQRLDLNTAYIKLHCTAGEAQKYLQEQRTLTEKLEVITELYNRSIAATMGMAMMASLSKNEFISTYEHILHSRQEQAKRIKYIQDKDALCRSIEQISQYLKQGFETPETQPENTRADNFKNSPKNPENKTENAGEG